MDSGRNEAGPDGGSVHELHHEARLRDGGGFYVTNGAFKGAMLAAGYKPVKRGEQNWQFRQRPTNKHADGYSYYHALPNDADPGIARFKDLVERVRAGRAS